MEILSYRKTLSLWGGSLDWKADRVVGRNLEMEADESSKRFVKLEFSVLRKRRRAREKVKAREIRKLENLGVISERKFREKPYVTTSDNAFLLAQRDMTLPTRWIVSIIDPR